MVCIFLTLFEVSTYSRAQKITFAVDNGDGVSVVPKEYLTNTVLYPSNISQVSANNVKIVLCKYCANLGKKKNLGEISRGR